VRRPVEIAPFDVCGPLPSGITVLEASAGTGKTFAIAALAARFVAEGTPLDRMLVVTFTRMATGELRDRVRERLVSAEEGLSRALEGVEPAGEDEVLALLASGSRAELEVRRANLARALADFDAATIATTHGFCQQVLSGLGVAGDVERDVAFVEDLTDLREEVVDDLYVRRFHWDAKTERFRRSVAMEIGRVAVENPLAPIEPPGPPGDNSTPAMRARLADAVRKEVERRKRAAAILTYDDLLVRLRATLVDPVHGEAACARLRERYRVALVDEFQDTDPLQWEIMQSAFGTGDATLVLVGDPKQAIYAFRGADVFAYLAAAADAGTRATLGVNWRSDQGLIDAYDAIFHGARLGHEGIAYRTVHAAPQNVAPRLSGAPVDAPLRVRVLHRDDQLIPLTERGYAPVGTSRPLVAEDLAADIVRLLSSEARIERRRGDGSTASIEPVRPGHVAVLVPTNRNAALVRDALEAAGVPAVINGAGSVFGTPTAGEWLRLLEAVERPTARARAAAAALTGFIGWSAERVAFADERAWEELHARLHRWAAVLRRHGLASLLETISISEGLPARILARPEGERQLTDLRHIGQLLHTAATEGQLGAAALTAWLRQRIGEASVDTADEDRSRRLESDAEAVQVLTVHRSKGLEFPIVYYPYLWDPGWVPEDAIPVYHDDHGVRTIDVGGSESPDWDEHQDRHLDEERGEDLRLAYVALTRARHQAVVWWVGSYASRDSALGRLLFFREEDGSVPTSGTFTPKDEAAAMRFTALAADRPGLISVERVTGWDGATWEAGRSEPAPLEAGRFERRLDPHWRRTSYSALTQDVHEAWAGSEPEEPGIRDEPVVGGASVPAAGEPVGEEARLRAVPSPLGAQPAGVEFGTFVHAVLEAADFAAPDIEAELGTFVERERARLHLDVGDPVAVVAGVRAALETPLGPLVGEARLRDVALHDRLDELAFEFPLAGGDSPAGELALADLAALLGEHLPAGDPVAGYAERLTEPGLQRELRGYLSGSIDLVVRLPGGGGPPRFAVIDYKTNRLGVVDEELSAWHYRPAALAEEMLRAHYPLQALLYTVALHRYLRWRVPGYDPGRNLAGVLYLFLRGMSGAATPRVGDQPCGVFAWRPPAALVEALSALLDAGRPS